MPTPAVFLDRDGVLVRDAGPITHAGQFAWEPGAPQAVRRLNDACLAVVVVSNQAAVARGLLSEAEVAGLHEWLRQQLRTVAGAWVDAFYSCPHHPHADVEAYRRQCDCRKPQPGLILRAAADLHLDLAGSYLVGDRGSDIAAGRRAGCRTILVTTGMHGRAPIVGAESLDGAETRPDLTCRDLAEAVELILRERTGAKSGSSGFRVQDLGGMSVASPELRTPTPEPSACDPRLSAENQQ
jgi:D-glycero-D-manno-heptose 1,7-bisphosphate phosphatase